jgi:hypothetical protein
LSFLTKKKRIFTGIKIRCKNVILLAVSNPLNLGSDAMIQNQSAEDCDQTHQTAMNYRFQRILMGPWEA